MTKKYGIKIEDLIREGDKVAQNALDHGVGTENHTLGEASHEDADYGQADPRVEASRKAQGDRTSRGGSGPDKKG